MAIPPPIPSAHLATSPLLSSCLARRGVAWRTALGALTLAAATTGAFAAAQAGPDCRRPLTLGLHEHGLLYAGETGEGIDKDIADELARRSGCHLTTLVLPRARIWQLIESGALDFSLSAITNRERDKFAAFAWYDSNKYYLLVRRDANVTDVSDFLRQKRLKLGAIRGFRYNEGANELEDALENESRVTYATSLEPLFEILLAGRIQGLIVEPFDTPVLRDEAVQAQAMILEFDDPPVLHGLVMSRKSLSPAQQAAWRALIDDMRADGTMGRIFAKYFPADLAQSMTRF